VVNLINTLLKQDLCGIECRSFVHGKYDENFFTQIAEKNKLLILGGTDWHGKYHHPDRIFGPRGSTKKEFERLASVL